jgi:acyl carrier protein
MTTKLSAADFATLQESIHEKFGIEVEAIAPDVVLATLDLDSLALIELSLTLQKKFGIVLATDDIAPRHTVGELADIVADAQAKALR